jgi:hypothetical protein
MDSLSLESPRLSMMDIYTQNDDNFDMLPKKILCPQTHERNPLTKRCNKRCKPGYVRNSKFKCRKQKDSNSNKQKNKKNKKNTIRKRKCKKPLKSPILEFTDIYSVQNSYDKPQSQVCGVHRERNPFTKRCNKRCKPNYVRTDSFRCTRKQPSPMTILSMSNTMRQPCKQKLVLPKKKRCSPILQVM